MIFGFQFFLRCMKFFIAAILCSLVFDILIMLLVRVDLHGALDAAVIAGTTRQRQVILTQNQYGAPATWTYAIDTSAAQVTAEQTWNKNLNQSGLLHFSPSIQTIDWSFPNSYTMDGSTSVTLTGKTVQNTFQFITKQPLGLNPEVSMPIFSQGIMKSRGKVFP